MGKVAPPANDASPSDTSEP